MNELEEWCREGLVSGLHALEESVRAVREGNPDGGEAVRRMARVVHATALSHGFAEVAQASSGVLDESGQVTPAAVETLVASLRSLTGVRDGGGRSEVLVVEDDPITARTLEVALEENGRRVVLARNGEEAKAWLVRGRPGLVILDLGLPDMDGRNLLAWFRGEASHAGTPVVVLTGKEIRLARAECLALGADDYLQKPLDREAFQVVAAAHLQRGLRRQPARLDGTGSGRASFQGLAGSSPAMQDVYRKLHLAAPTGVTILLTGESGTGKEMAAHAMHEQSRRKGKPFVAVNCSALPETLLESELFGHVKGAFTDAFRDKVGVFQSADGGTLFLDEIGDLSPLLQLKLLRVIQEREIRRVGDERPFRVDVRLIAATNRDLKALLAAGSIRDDFYYRIRVFEIKMPPLRERTGDLPLLVKDLLGESDEARRKGVTGVTREALAAMQDYPWPGNVRELSNALEHAMVSVQGPAVALADLPEEIRSWIPRREGGAGRRDRLNDGEERTRILAALAECGGQRARAARRLGISRITLWKRMRKLGLEGTGKPA